MSDTLVVSVGLRDGFVAPGDGKRAEGRRSETRTQTCQSADAALLRMTRLHGHAAARTSPTTVRPHRQAGGGRSRGGLRRPAWEAAPGDGGPRRPAVSVRLGAAPAAGAWPVGMGDERWLGRVLNCPVCFGRASRPKQTETVAATRNHPRGCRGKGRPGSTPDCPRVRGTHGMVWGFTALGPPRGREPSAARPAEGSRGFRSGTRAFPTGATSATGGPSPGAGSGWCPRRSG